MSTPTLVLPCSHSPERSCLGCYLLPVMSCADVSPARARCPWGRHTASLESWRRCRIAFGRPKGGGLRRSVAFSRVVSTSAMATARITETTTIQARRLMTSMYSWDDCALSVAFRHMGEAGWSGDDTSSFWQVRMWLQRGWSKRASRGRHFVVARDDHHVDGVSTCAVIGPRWKRPSGSSRLVSSSRKVQPATCGPGTSDARATVDHMIARVSHMRLWSGPKKATVARVTMR